MVVEIVWGAVSVRAATGDFTIESSCICAQNLWHAWVSDFMFSVPRDSSTLSATRTQCAKKWRETNERKKNKQIVLHKWNQNLSALAKGGCWASDRFVWVTKFHVRKSERFMVFFSVSGRVAFPECHRHSRVSSTAGQLKFVTNGCDVVKCFAIINHLAATQYFFSFHLWIHQKRSVVESYYQVDAVAGAAGARAHFDGIRFAFLFSENDRHGEKTSESY